MINLKNCACGGQLRTVQSGGFHMDTRITKLKCNQCGQLCCSVQFIASIEVMKYARVDGENGKKSRTAPRLRNPITVDLHPHLAPELLIHKPKTSNSLCSRDSAGRFTFADDPWLE